MFTKLAVLVVAMQFAFFQDAPVRETYDDGRLKAEYRLDSDGRKHGAYTEWHLNGKKKQAGTFFHGVLDGSWDDFCESSGRIAFRRRYDKSTIKEVRGFDEGGSPPYLIQITSAGPVLTGPGGKAELIFKRKQSEVTTKLTEIEGPGYEGEQVATPSSWKAPYKPGKLVPAYLADAARHAAAYRWLCGLSTDVEIDPVRAETCQHACTLLAALDRGLSHTPARASGMDEAFYKRAYEGANKSNLHMGQSTLRQSVDGFMDDSDPKNIEHVGHRMWILQPGMKKTAFGQVEGFVAMWVTDQPGSAPSPDQLRYPAPGYFPAPYLKSHAAWNCLMTEGKYQFKDLAVRAWLLDEDYAPKEQLAVTDTHANKSNVIFKPNLPKDLKGLRVLVQIQGVKQGKTEVPMMYMVEFFDK